MSEQKKKRKWPKVLLIMFGGFVALSVLGSIFESDFTQNVESETGKAIGNISGKAKGADAKVSINGVAVSIENEKYKHSPRLKVGENIFKISYTADGETVVKEVTINRLSKIELRKKTAALAAKECKRSPEKHQEVLKTTWKTGGFGSIAMHRVLVRNNCPIAVKDYSFKVKYFAKSGTKIDSLRRTVHDKIGPKKSKWMKFKGFVHSEASTSTVEVSDSVAL